GKVVYWKKVDNGKLGGDDRRDELGGENEKNLSWGNTNGFWEYYHRFPCTNKLPSNAADMYIDDIDWNSKIDPKLFLEIKSISDDEEEEEEVKRIHSFSIPLEQIKAT
ncbi:hypothetical protein Goklo_028840, partial [Gossypium klotzschianum]|nr:hypothetical protein [Gossypium klotzschianum]